jgi:hypothetical protein
VRWGTNGAYASYSNSQGDQYNPKSGVYVITGLTNGVTYNFSLRAKDSTGKYTSSDYTTVSVTATPVGPVGGAPLAPIGFRTSFNFNTMSVTWGKVSNAVAYDVSLNNASPVRYTSAGFKVGVKDGGSYQLSVRSVNSSGQTSATPSTTTINTQCILYYWCSVK